jgi:hypothetical protein
LRTAGIAAAVAGAIALIAPFAWRSFWPTPIATIDEPDAQALVDGCFVVRGRVLPSTIWKPLWLIEAWDGSGWRPVQKIDPLEERWQAKTCVHGRTRGQFGLALVVVDRERDEAFRVKPAEPPEEPIPDWLKRRSDEQCARRGRRHYPRGFDPIPAGATLVAAKTVRVRAGDQDDYEPPLCSYTPLER